MTDWRAYQEEVAEHFRLMGHDADVESEVRGVRSVHKVDVWVQFEMFGLRTAWVVECKAWRSRIPKEKVAALKFIVDDIGADRGFLLSEVGFQPGAEAAATGTNVTLTSLKALRSAADDDFDVRAMRSIRLRLAELEEQLHGELVAAPDGVMTHLRAREGISAAHVMNYIGVVSTLRNAVERADLGLFPVVVPSFGARGRFVQSVGLRSVIGESVLWLEELTAWHKSLPPRVAS